MSANNKSFPLCSNCGELHHGEGHVCYGNDKVLNANRNQVLDEAKEVYKAERFKSKTNINAQDETSRVINAIEGLKQ